MRLIAAFTTLVLVLWPGHGFPLEPPASSTQSARLEPPRARVVIGENQQATAAFVARAEPVQAMVMNGLLRLTGKPTIREAWLSLVSAQDTVGLKVFSAPGPRSGTRYTVVAALVETLLAAGLPPKQIVVWDRRLADLRSAGFFELAELYGVRVAGSAEAGYDPDVAYESALLGRLVWGDHEFGKKEEGVGRKSFVSKLVTQQMTKIVSVPPLLNHNLAGVSGHLYSLTIGSVDNSLRFEVDPARLAEAVPELLALPSLGDRLVLCVTDALIGQYYGEEQSLLHYASMLNQLWFSRDPVALDVLGLRQLDTLRDSAKAPRTKPRTDLYENAGILDLGVSDLKAIATESWP